jgi:hypothetical protein
LSSLPLQGVKLSPALPEAWVFTGIDWAAEVPAVYAMDAAGKVVSQFTTEHSADGIAVLIRRLARFGDPADLPVAIERPDDRLVDLLLEAGHPVVPSSRTRSRPGGTGRCCPAPSPMPGTPR